VKLSNLPPGCTNDAIERAAGWRPKTKRATPKKYRCECGWKGNKPIQAECPTCPDCGLPAIEVTP
jgi:hypothetical protein